MQTSVFVLAALAAFAAASPTDIQPRAFGVPLGGGSVASTTSGQQSSSTTAQSGFTGGPFGGGATSSYSHRESSSYSSSTVLNTWQGLGGQISAFQNMLAGGAISQQIAMSRMQQLAGVFQTALTQAPMCGGCFGQSPFLGGVSNVFQHFYSLLTTMRARFGAGFMNQCLAPFGGLRSSFQSFFQSASRSSVSASTIMPGGLAGLMTGALPNFGTIAGFK